jgi:hypothetical protein
MTAVRSPERLSAAGPSLVEAFERPRYKILPVSLAPCFADPAAKAGGVHVYTFNELKTTETWRRQLVDRLNNQEETP